MNLHKKVKREPELMHVISARSMLVSYAVHLGLSCRILHIITYPCVLVGNSYSNHFLAHQNTNLKRAQVHNFKQALCWATWPHSKAGHLEGSPYMPSLQRDDTLSGIIATRSCKRHSACACVCVRGNVVQDRTPLVTPHWCLDICEYADFQASKLQAAAPSLVRSVLPMCKRVVSSDLGSHDHGTANDM